MSRRSSRYKGGVTRGREEQPQGNSTMKRGSPKTKKAGSKSNTGAGEIQIKQACQKVGKIDQKKEDISRSLNSFDTGAIFLHPSGQDLSRDVVVVSVYAF